MSFFRDLGKFLSENIRNLGMFIALFVIMIIFDITTNGLFLSPRNLGNLLNQSGYIAVLAVGMTLVIVIRHIDLSVGFLAGFLGAVAAIMLKLWGFPVYLVIPLVLGLGIVAGMITASPVALLGIPSFVASLAGWLIYRGLVGAVLSSTGTVVTDNKIFNAIGNGFIPDIPFLTFFPTIHKITLLVGIIAIVLFILSSINSRRKKQAYNFEVPPMDMFILQLVVVSALVAGITWVLANYNGLSWTFVIVLIVVGIYQFITTQTVIGRHIYAVGGNPEAAGLSGVNVKRITFIVFASMGMLSALSGILFTSRLKSATPTAGSLFELDAIAAAYVGGVSAAGGVGSVVGSLVGALVMFSLTNGMQLMGVDIFMQYIVRGLVLVLAVIFDVTTRNRAK
jgi:putative multiple sugar transport system permease protein